MKERKQLVALAGVFAALLVILLVVVIAQYVKKQQLDKETDSQGYYICEIDELKTLSIVSSEGDKTVFQLSSDHIVTSIEHNGTNFDAVMLNSSEVKSALDQVLHFSLNNSFDAPSSDMSAYGLTSPHYVISAEMNDGTSKTVSIGDLVADKNGIYAKASDEDRVLVAQYSLYKVLTGRFETYLNRVVLNLERSNVNEISFERTSTKDRWVVKPLEDYDNGVYIEPRYRVLYPMDREPNDAMYNLLASILQFQVSQYVPIADEDMAAYGLDKPEYKINIRLNSGEEITINLSMEIGGYYYGTCSNNPYTFRVNPSGLPGLNKPSFDLIDSYVIHGYLDDVSTVQVTVKDKSFVIDCRLNESMTFESEDSTFQLDKRNAKVYSSSGECYGLLLFGSIFNMPVSRVDYDAKPELKNVEATIHVVKNTGEITDLKLVPIGDTEYYCFINDYYSGFIVDRSVLYRDNGREMSDFGVWDAYCLTTEAIDNKDANDIYDRP